MRLPDSLKLLLHWRSVLTPLVAGSLSACAGIGGGGEIEARANGPELPVSGPGADYPVTLGAPYMVNGTEYVPVDTLNVDQVGYAGSDDALIGYTASHHTLPLPSYAEVTDLESGRTVLVRVEARGPMDSTHVVALSPAAMSQLGIDNDAAVRLRRVNPPEENRALLRSGEAAPIRMETPVSLLTVLRRRLPASGAAFLRPRQTPAGRSSIQTIRLEPSIAIPDSELQDRVAQLPAAAVPPQPDGDIGSLSDETSLSYEVQAATFGNRKNAVRAAEALGARLVEAGRFYRVRTGPFATRAQAEASLANVRRAGYSDARIQTGD